jgi:hypothetical protein
MECLYQLYLVCISIFAIFVAVSSVVFVFLQRRWPQLGHGDSNLQKEKTVILPPFWAAWPAAWFAYAKSKFRKKAVTSQQRRFDFLLVAIPEKILNNIMDEVDSVPEDLPYNVLKSRLLETHTLSDQEKLDVLFKSEPLGGWKPSQLLANMLAYCPSGMKQTVMFQYMFLQSLPVTLRTLLGEQEPGDIRSLAARADNMWATHKHQSHDVVANVEPAEDQPAQIAAVQKATKKKKLAGKQKPGNGGQAVSRTSGGLSHSERALVASGLCFSHWVYGPNAKKCETPCNWTGN